MLVAKVEKRIPGKATPIAWSGKDGLSAYLRVTGMAEAGVSIACHAKPVVREKATYCFDYVGLDGLLNLYTARQE